MSDPFAIFDELDFDDVEAGKKDEILRINLKKISSGVILNILLKTDALEKTNIKPGQLFKLQAADMDEDIAFRISRTDSKAVGIPAKEYKAGRKDLGAQEDRVQIRFDRMKDFGAGAFKGCPSSDNVHLKDGAILLILPKGENPVQTMSRGKAGQKRLPSGNTNPSGVIFEYYANGRYKPTRETDENMERMIKEGSSIAQIVAHYGNQIKAEDVKARLSQLKNLD